MGKPIQYCVAQSTVKDGEPFEFPGHDRGPKVAVWEPDASTTKFRSFIGERTYAVAHVCLRCGVVYVPFKDEENPET
jgi:hypothetical protein